MANPNSSPSPHPDPLDSVSPANPILIVVGAHLSAELYDRPIAYRLREQLMRAVEKSLDSKLDPGSIVVLSDLWFLNRDELRSQPFITVGGPTVNALTASLADKLPSIFAIDGQLITQMDADGEVPIAACWGTGPAETARACDEFMARGLELFLDAIL